VKRRLGPLLSILLLAGLVAYVYFVELRGRREGTAAETGKDRPISFERATLKSVRLTNDSGSLKLEKAGEQWRLTEPLQTDADKDAVEGLLNSLEMAHIERRLGKGEDRKQYGLDPPKATVTLETAGAGGGTLGIGESSPIGGSWYALLPGGNEVAVVSSTIGDMAHKDALALRDKALLALDPWKIKKLTLERGKETIRLEKPDDGWVVRQPVEAPADGPTITDLLNALQTLRATRFDSEKPAAADLKRCGLSPPLARMVLLQDGWDVEKTVEFGKEAAGGGRYARTLGRDPVLTVPADFWTKVTTKFFDLRRRELLGVQQYRVETVVLARHGRPAITLQRGKDQDWTVSGGAQGTIKSESADTLLRMVSDLKALAFDDNPKESVRSGVLKEAALDLTLTEESDAASGKQKSQHLLVSGPDKAGHVLVRDMAWRPIAIASADVLKKIDTQIDDLLKEAATPKPQASASPSAAPAPSPSP